MIVYTIKIKTVNSLLEIINLLNYNKLFYKTTNFIFLFDSSSPVFGISSKMLLLFHTLNYHICMAES